VYIARQFFVLCWPNFDVLLVSQQHNELDDQPEHGEDMIATWVPMGEGVVEPAQLVLDPAERRVAAAASFSNAAPRKASLRHFLLFQITANRLL